MNLSSNTFYKLVKWKENIWIVDKYLEEKLRTLVKEAIADGLDLIEFMDFVKFSVLNAIAEGFIFDDYLDNYDLVEDALDPLRHFDYI